MRLRTRPPLLTYLLTQLRRGTRPASLVWCRPGFCRPGDERVCPGEVRNPYPLLVRLVIDEPPDPHVDEVVQGTLSQGEERLEFSHTDVCSRMSEEGSREAPVAADILEMRSEGVYQVV